MTDMKKVVSGDPLVIPAATHNAFIDAARFTESLRNSRGGLSKTDIRMDGLCYVKNSSGANRNRHDVLGIDGPAYNPRTHYNTFLQTIILKGIEPDADVHDRGKFVVLAEPLVSGEIGLAWCDGVVPVRLDPDTIEDATRAKVVTGDYEILQGDTSEGMQIVWLDDTDDELGPGTPTTPFRWALIRFDRGGDEASDLTGNSAGCCAACVPCRYMTVFHGIFAQTYYASPIPNLLIPGNEALDGDGVLSIEYIGISSGLDGVPDGHPYWESDTFDYTCSGVATGPCSSAVEFSYVDGVCGESGVLRWVSGSTWRSSPQSTAGCTDIVAELDTVTEVLTFTWTSLSLGACSYVYHVTGGSSFTCDGSTTFLIFSGTCTPPDNITLTGSTGTAPTQTDQYLWRMYNMALETADCHTLASDEMVGPYLVKVGSAQACNDLTAVNCGSACGTGGEYGDCPVCPESTLFDASTEPVFTITGPSTVGVVFDGANALNVGCLWWSDGDYGDGTYEATLDLETGIMEISVDDGIIGSGTATYSGTITCNGTVTMTKDSSSGAITFANSFDFTVT